MILLWFGGQRCQACNRRVRRTKPNETNSKWIHKQAKLRETKKCRSTGQQPRTKSACRPADKPLINRGSTAHFVPSVYIGFRLFVLLEKRSSDVSSIPWRVQGTCVSWANNSVGTQSCPTPPGRPAERPDPTRPWYVRVLDSTSIFMYVCICVCMRTYTNVYVYTYIHIKHVYTYVDK